MKSSKAQILAKFRKIPVLRFEDQQLTSFSGLLIFQQLFQRIQLKRRLRACFAHLTLSPIFGRHLVVLLLVVHLLLGFRRLWEVDYYIYEPKAFVGHRVLEERVLRTWGLRRAFDHGRSISILKTFYNNKEWQHWISTSFQAVPKIFEKICVALTKLIRRKNNEYFEQLINSAIWVGIAWNSIGQGLALKINYEKQVRKLQA